MISCNVNPNLGASQQKDIPVRWLSTVARLCTGLFAVMLLTACSDSGSQNTPTPVELVGTPSLNAPAQQHVLELEITGNATLSTLTFTLDGNTSEEQSVALPWHKSVTVPQGTGRHEWKLTMQHSGGKLLAKATVNGRLLTQTAGSSSPGSNNTANLSGSFAD